MKSVKKFEEFIKNGIVKKQSPNISRAQFLEQESKQNFEILEEIIEKIGISDKNSNHIVKTCYDILMELVRAKMLLKGFNALGQGAHEAEVSYLRQLGFSENEIQVAEQLRYFRNGMLYYGTMLDSEYAKKVVGFIKKIRERLLDS